MSESYTSTVLLQRRHSQESRYILHIRACNPRTECITLSVPPPPTPPLPLSPPTPAYCQSLRLLLPPCCYPSALEDRNKSRKTNPARPSSFPGMPQTFPVNNLATAPVNRRPTRDPYVRIAPESLPTITMHAVVTVTVLNFCFSFKFLSERANEGTATKPFAVCRRCRGCTWMSGQPSSARGLV